VINPFIEGTIQKARDSFTEKLTDLFSDKNLDVFLDYKISQLEPSLQKAILEETRKEGKD
jgi:predicted HD phosphohydrolase